MRLTLILTILIKPHGFSCIQHCLTYLHLLAFPFTISKLPFATKTTMTLKVQNRPKASAFGYAACTKHSNYLMSVSYLLLPYGTLSGAIKKRW